MEAITEKQLRSAISRQFNLNIKNNGISTSKASMMRIVNPYIHEVRTGLIIMKDGWREAIKNI